MLRNFIQIHTRDISSGTNTGGESDLETNDIQGDILVGLQKNAERFIFFGIQDIQAFKSALREKIAPEITTTEQTIRNEHALIDAKAKGEPLSDATEFFGFNIGFTREGLAGLISDVDMNDDSFAAGAIQRAGQLGDQLDGDGRLAGWKPEFTTEPLDIHGLILVTGKSQESVEKRASEILADIGSSIVVRYAETGLVRPTPNRGHEHFGWKDGISQPGVKGIENLCEGQRPIDAGSFVFGYGQNANLSAPQSWLRNGSFLVFRRLQQFVPEFEAFLAKLQQRLALIPICLERN
ncbi:MAG: hypothetical protein JOZ32_22010 [Bryobacterales bacterium]|nr:hypothetical protein [Bryobacterales bacterium]